MILNEFDNEKIAIINPNDLVEKQENFPKIAVSCFSKVLLEAIVLNFESEIIAYLKGANGKIPVYKIKYRDVEVALFMSKVGSASAAGDYEDIIAMGIEKFIVFGTCGVLTKELEELSIIIPTSAIRDEGTSYHYMPASEEITVNEKYKEEFIQLLNKYNYTYEIGKTWTTDAFYRETTEKVKRRKEQGAICVEMECSALSAVSKFRNVDFFEFFYAADNLDDTKWDKRNLSCEKDLEPKVRLGMLALEFAVKISKV